MKFGIGQSVRRTEDIRFVTGQGQYTDDIVLANQAHAAFVRSPHGHARIKRIDVSAARNAPGVVGVLVQDDVAAMGARVMPDMAPVKSRDGSVPRKSPKTLLAKDAVRFAGEAIAMVVAETMAQARDAAELVAVDFEPLDAAGTLAAAPTGPQIWESAPGNLCFDWADGNEKACDDAFAKAAHKIVVDVVQNRVAPTSMEGRAANASYDAETDTYLLYTGTQGSGSQRDRVAMILNIGKEKLRLVTPDVGGGFGMKGFTFPEQMLVCLAAKACGRPVKWTSDRTEAFLADCHGRDCLTRGELALDADGKILALRITGTANMGGYLSQYGPFIATVAGGRLFGGVYRVPAVFANVKGYFSNSAPVDAYRGAGRPEAAYLMERLMDVAALETGLDRIEIRRRNLLGPDELPYQNWAGFSFDSGEFAGAMDEAIAATGYAGFAARKAEAAKRGKLRGLGIAYYVEVTAAMGMEPGAIRFTENGGVEVVVATQSTGQGHETAFAQLVAEKLGVPFESVAIKQGDTAFGVDGFGTGGSRSLNMAGGAVLAASEEVIRKGKIAAGQVLQAGGKDVTFAVAGDVGRFQVSGTDRAIGVGELAVTLKRSPIPGLEGGLDSDAVHQGKAPTFPNGCHICEVEIDPDTGAVEVLAYHAVDDFGRVVNPMLVAGQVHGGVAQGLGQALLEEAVYDGETGQMMTATFMDYAMPRAADMPAIDVRFHNVPCKTNELGVKGCGEAGTVGALPVVVSAVCDALGVAHIDMPLTPEKVWRAAQERRAD